MLPDPHILFIKSIKFLTKTEIDFFETRNLELFATDQKAEKLIDIDCLNFDSHEEAIFKKHYKKYISLTNKLNTQTVSLGFISFVLTLTITTLFYADDLTYFLYQEGIRRGNQAVYSSSFVGTHEFVWAVAFLLLFFYLVWKIYLEEIIYILDLEGHSKNIQEANQSRSAKREKALGPTKIRVKEILITLFMLSVFLAAWGIWVAFSTYPSPSSRTFVLSGVVGFYILISLAISISLGTFSFTLANYALKRKIPDSIIVSKLGNLILFLDSESSNVFESIDSKNSVIKSLEEITTCFSDFLPHKIHINNIREKNLTY